MRPGRGSRTWPIAWACGGCSSTATSRRPAAAASVASPSRRCAHARERTWRRRARPTTPTTCCSTASSPAGPAGRGSRWMRGAAAICRRSASSSPAACVPTRWPTSSGCCGRSRSTSRPASSGPRGARTMKRSRASAAAQRLPDAQGHFGVYGGRYVAETLMPALLELEHAWARLRRDARFRREFHGWLRDYAGRPTRLYFARRLSERLGGARIYLKREDLLHTGAHKVNNTIGPALVARGLGKARRIAETGAGQHGVATATVAALFGLRCEVFMGAEDVQRQSLNVFRMKLLGAEVRVVDAGSRTLKDAMNEALRD